MPPDSVNGVSGTASAIAAGISHTLAIATESSAPTCADFWPVDSITTIANGQSAANNVKVSHFIVGNIIDPNALCPNGGACNAARVPVCAGTEVTIAVSDTTGGATNNNIGKGDIVCGAAGCTVSAVNVTEKYKSVSFDGKDTDRVTLLPQ